jgi:hypothetical protein
MRHSDILPLIRTTYYRHRKTPTFTPVGTACLFIIVVIVLEFRLFAQRRLGSHFSTSAGRNKKKGEELILSIEMLKFSQTKLFGGQLRESFIYVYRILEVFKLLEKTQIEVR